MNGDRSEFVRVPWEIADAVYADDPAGMLGLLSLLDEGWEPFAIVYEGFGKDGYRRVYLRRKADLFGSNKQALQ